MPAFVQKNDGGGSGGPSNWGGAPPSAVRMQIRIKKMRYEKRAMADKWKIMAENFAEAFASDSVHNTYKNIWVQVCDWAKADKLSKPENVRVVQKIIIGEKGTEVEVEFSIFADGKEISAKKKTTKSAKE